MNNFFAKLPFKRLLESIVSEETRAKIPLVGTVVNYSNQIVVLLVAALLANAVLGGGGSSGAVSGNIRQSDFNGTWRTRDGRSEITISSREIFQRNLPSGLTLGHTINSVTAMTSDNANYPSGFRFDTTITRNDNNNWAAVRVGENVSRTFFMHTGKREFRETRTGFIYRKQ